MIERVYLLDIYRIRLSQKYRDKIFFFFFFGTIKSATLEHRYDNFIHRKVKKKKKKERIKSTNMGEIKFIHFARLRWEEHREIDKNKSRGIFMEVISGKEESNDVYV